MNRFQTFYRKYICPYDPDRYGLRFVIKSSGAILLSVLILYRFPVLPVAAVIWHIKALADELEAIRQPVEHLVHV